MWAEGRRKQGEKNEKPSYLSRLCEEFNMQLPAEESVGGQAKSKKRSEQFPQSSCLDGCLMMEAQRCQITFTF